MTARGVWALQRAAALAIGLILMTELAACEVLVVAFPGGVFEG